MLNLLLMSTRSKYVSCVICTHAKFGASFLGFQIMICWYLQFYNRCVFLCLVCGQAVLSITGIEGCDGNLDDARSCERRSFDITKLIIAISYCLFGALFRS